MGSYKLQDEVCLLLKKDIPPQPPAWRRVKDLVCLYISLSVCLYNEKCTHAGDLDCFTTHVLIGHLYLKITEMALLCTFPVISYYRESRDCPHTQTTKLPSENQTVSDA